MIYNNNRNLHLFFLIIARSEITRFVFCYFLFTWLFFRFFLQKIDPHSTFENKLARFRVCLQIANEPRFEFFSPESTSLCLGNIAFNIAQAKRGALRGKELKSRPL
jgi:hypothetical protein